MAVGEREADLLTKLVMAEKAHPSELFVVAWVNGPQPVLKHPGISAFIDPVALVGLEAAGYLLVQSWDGARPKSFYLSSDAPRELEEIQTRSAAESAAGEC